ncbi:hypothetical protein OpiT1DRAFT_05007 [Opitutaceae bacterium TAV1]|nr:hypothetical protein OpiT1DRAFT_05007 [Opitutaceae bacterium TAV1]
MSSGYDFSLSAKALHALLGASARWRRMAMAAIEQLAKDPFADGDLKELSPEGRTYLVIVRENIILTWWADHSARIVHIMLIEFVKD